MLLHVRHSFPPEISRGVGRIPNEQWQILRLLRREKGTLELLAINPALLFSLAVASRNEAQFCLPPDLGELRQRELAFYLRFPESEAMVRILRKIPPEALSEDRLNRLRNAVASPEVLKALSHVGVVSAAVIALTAEPLLFASVTPSFLAEVAQDDGAPEGEGVVVLTLAGVAPNAGADGTGTICSGRFPGPAPSIARRTSPGLRALGGGAD